MENYLHEDHAVRTYITAYYLASFSRREDEDKNIGMRSMQELFFLVGWVPMGQFGYIMFSFLSTKRALLSNNENIVERQKKAN